MITLLGTLIGFISSLAPDMLKLVRDRADRKHELAILDMQLKQQSQGHSERLAEINAQGDIAESKALYRTWESGVKWVDALNGSVRPVLAYSFFLLYAVMKWQQIESGLPWLVWTEEDQAIFAGIISFYFGQRAMQKVRMGK